MDYLDRIPDEEYQDKLTALMTALANARKQAKHYHDRAVEELEDAISGSNYENLREAMEMWQKQEHMFYEHITKLALELDSNGQTLPDALKVKNFKEVEIPDEKKAREWCLQHFTPALTLDRKVFEKAVKDGNIPEELGTVTVVKKAQVSQDLSAYGG